MGTATSAYQRHIAVTLVTNPLWLLPDCIVLRVVGHGEDTQRVVVVVHSVHPLCKLRL